MSPTALPARVAAAVGGQVLRAATAGLAAARPAGKPLHPRGSVVQGRLHRFGAAPATGVRWLDEPGQDAVLARVSRAVGLPAALPDIHGLALRVPGEQGPGDLLLASTGLGRLTRFVLSATHGPGGRPMTTLLPYRTPTGPVLLGARLAGPSRWELAVASPWGSWRRFADLELDQEPGRDQAVSFDPVRHEVPGLRTYPWVRLLREPSYRTARRSRADDAPTREAS